MSLFAAIADHNKLVAIKKMPIETIDFSTLPDGYFEGKFCHSKFCYSVGIQLSDHKITEIKILRNKVSKYADKGATITQKVIQAQNLQVDAISKATITSKSLLKAIENALHEAAKSANP
jgi:uncharacterized protein with FMN-binding domain